MGRSLRVPQFNTILPARFIPAAVVALVLTLLAPARASILMYDASTGELPADPPFRYEDTSSLFGSAVTPTISGGIASLGPTSDEGRSFWYTDQLVLPDATGFDISATLRLDSESSSDPTDQSGLAIAFSDDQTLYQNLFIDPTGVFFSKLNIDSTAIVRDTSYTLDTTEWQTYTIGVQDDGVTLSIDGTPVLTSTLFNLSATGQLVLPDTVAIGDISPIAQSQFDVSTFSVTVPEPSYAGAGLLGMAVVVAMRLRRPIPQPA